MSFGRFKRIDTNWGGYKDGVTYIVKPDLRKSNKSEFLAQEDIAKLRTGRVVTRDEEGFVKIADTAEEIPMGLVSFGFLDRLETHEDYNANVIGEGEGLSVLTGRFQSTLPLTDNLFDGDITAVKAGQKVFSTEGKDGKMAFGDGAVEIGYVAMVTADDVTIEFKL